MGYLLALFKSFPLGKLSGGLTALLILALSILWGLYDLRGKELENARWEAAAAKAALDASQGRADQATEALKRAQEAQKLLSGKLTSTQAELARMRATKASQAQSSAVQGCRDAYKTIQEALYQ